MFSGDLALVHATERVSYGYADWRFIVGRPMTPYENIVYRQCTGPTPRSHVTFAELDGVLTTLIRQQYPTAWEPMLESFFARG